MTHMKQVNGTALLVTIAEDLSHEPVLKVWALDKTEKKTGDPSCLSSLTVQNGRKQFPVRFSCRKTQMLIWLIRSDIGFCGT